MLLLIIFSFCYFPTNSFSFLLAYFVRLFFDEVLHFTKGKILIKQLLNRLKSRSTDVLFLLYNKYNIEVH